MEMRLQKALAQAGVASRRHGEELISAGRVEVNGAIVRTLGTKVDPDRDLIRVDGELVASKEQKVYLVLFKPVGVVTTLSDPQGRRTVRDLLQGVSERVFAVGRLDYDAEGALLVTNDGDLANRLMHPRYGVPRTYLAKVKGEPDEATLALLRTGVRLEDGVARPDRAQVHTRAERNTWLELVVSEGRPHLVKRLCAAIGHPVVRLFRPRYAGIGVEGLSPGAWRALTSVEVDSLRRVAQGDRLPPEPPIKLPPRQHRAEESEAAAVLAPGSQVPQRSGRPRPSRGGPHQGPRGRAAGRGPARGGFARRRK